MSSTSTPSAEAARNCNVFIGIRKRGKPRGRNLKTYLVRFSDGLGNYADRNVIANSYGMARRLAEPTVPAALYPNHVFLFCRLNKNFPLTIDADCLQLLIDKVESEHGRPC
jgi:hypothetical protein